MNKKLSALTMERIQLQQQLRLLATRPADLLEETTEPEDQETPQPEPKPAKTRVIRGGKWKATATPQPIFQPKNI